MCSTSMPLFCPPSMCVVDSTDESCDTVYTAGPQLNRRPYREVCGRIFCYQESGYAGSEKRCRFFQLWESFSNYSRQHVFLFQNCKKRSILLQESQQSIVPNRIASPLLGYISVLTSEPSVKLYTIRRKHWKHIDRKQS
jgi:hypothetical protein